MSNPPLNYGSPQVFHRPGPNNVVGLIGFIFVMVGLAGFCFAPFYLLGLVGTVLCAIGIFRQPRGLAIAGLIVGLIELLIGLLALAFLGVIIGAGVSAANEQAKMAVSSNHARDIGLAVDRYKREHQSLPASITGVVDATVLNDGWGNPIRYVIKGDKYQLFSNGRDGKSGTADDISLYDGTYVPYTTTTIPTMPPARKPKAPPPFPTSAPE